ncbi:hypothetical protein FZEAL_7300 [Fusarium zealandicum]|uniref:Uncharacterized protein n=1 Tax=Fusarium zealandicum TaxID=1053134 RepID=A0A8H4UH31_9HYPO|nr:hypothetical protein FZEAL_7300 [Fusarium zealandicum]
MHLAQLLFQHNDLVSSEDDCRNKYVARQLFRRLAKQGRLSTLGFAQDNWSAAVTKKFVLDPPWWLLFETPEMRRPSGVDEWSKAYGLQLETWLKAMEEQEKGAAFLDGIPLSAHMRESWETGRFWLNYAARKSWAFDAVFWNFLDQRFFGARHSGVPDEELWKTRLDLLSREEQQAMEPFVTRKMEESRERILVEWEPAEARRRLSELLFGPSTYELTPPVFYTMVLDQGTMELEW